MTYTFKKVPSHVLGECYAALSLMLHIDMIQKTFYPLLIVLSLTFLILKSDNTGNIHNMIHET